MIEICVSLFFLIVKASVSVWEWVTETETEGLRHCYIDLYLLLSRVVPCSYLGPYIFTSFASQPGATAGRCPTESLATPWISSGRKIETSQSAILGFQDSRLQTDRYSVSTCVYIISLRLHISGSVYESLTSCLHRCVCNHFVYTAGISGSVKVNMQHSSARAGFFVISNLILMLLIKDMLLLIRINILGIVFQFIFFIIFSFEIYISILVIL